MGGLNSCSDIVRTMGNNQPSQDAKAFAERLNSALDHTPGVPPLNEGRGAWLARRMRVTDGTVNGWLNGRFMPKPARVRALAALTHSAYDWLYFGAGGVRDSSPAPLSLVVPELSHTERHDDIIIAFRLAAEAIGRDLYLPPDRYAELGLLIVDLLQQGLGEAQVVSIARRTAQVLATGEQGNNGVSAQHDDAHPSASGRGAPTGKTRDR